MALLAVRPSVASMALGLAFNQVKQLLLAVHIKLRVDMLRVTLHGVLGQVKRLGDVRFRASFAQQLHDFQLAGRQLVLLANFLAALLKASVIRRRAYRFAVQFREQPLCILVAHLQTKGRHQYQHEHQCNHDHGIVFAFLNT